MAVRRARLRSRAANSVKLASREHPRCRFLSLFKTLHRRWAWPGPRTPSLQRVPAAAEQKRREASAARSRTAGGAVEIRVASMPEFRKPTDQSERDAAPIVGRTASYAVVRSRLADSESASR